MATIQGYAKVLIEKERLSSLQESISIGKQVLERKLAVYKKKIEKFEQARGMDNEAFMASFNKGELGDERDFLGCGGRRLHGVSSKRGQVS